MRILLAQINTTVGDIENNKAKVLGGLDRARREKSELVVFPELTLTGYPPEDLLFREAFIANNLKALRSLVPLTGGLAAVVGFVDRNSRGDLFNAAAVLAGKKILGVYHKAELPNYGVFDERRYFTPGSGSGVIGLSPGVRLGVTICEDIWQKNSFIYSKAYRGSASLLVNLSASPFHAGKQKERITLLKKVVSHVKAPVIYLNLVGGQDELVFDGGSFVMDRSGNILAEAGRFEEQLLAADIPPGPVSRRRGPKPSSLSYEAEVYQALVLGTRDYIQKNGFKKALVGLSGGIDSALVAAIAVDALGAENVVGVTMPSSYTSRETFSDAKLLAKNLGIQCLEFPIGDILEGYLNTLKKGMGAPAQGITEENLQARIRGNLLMALSNQCGYLVLTTGNKSEMATGYCTLYGDMAGGFAVIKDVPKTLVFRLARHRNTLAPINSIPQSILRRPPTAELRPNQKDEDSLPPYKLLDRFLELYVEKDMPISRILKRGIVRGVAHQIKRMVDHNEYKRRQAPPGVKITPKAFGRDRRMPITNRFAG